MAEPVVYMRGFPPAIIEALAANENAIADLKAVASLDDEQVQAIRSALSQVKGFLDPKALTTTIRESLGDDSAAGSVQRTLLNIGPGDTKRFLGALSARREEEDFPLDQSTFDKLSRMLPALVQPYPALARFRKAERLATLTGQQLESVELICDLRPVFDEERARLDGMMPYTRLRIVTTGADGLPNEFEAELTHQQVHDLADKASKAKDKLDVLRESVEQWVPGGLPVLPLTRVPRKESSDA
jgi:hypothetical protein